MLIQIETLKSYLGLPETADAVADPILERSSMIAQNMVSGYVGMDIEAGDDAKTYTMYGTFGLGAVRLPEFPILRVLDVTIDGVLVPASEYNADNRLGMVILLRQRASVNTCSVRYVPGFDSETLPVDLTEALINIALGVYSKNGNMSTTSTSGALKSLTMFDAMSMSFDVGATTGDSDSPEGMLKQWAFVLDKYKVDKYVMGN